MNKYIEELNAFLRVHSYMRYSSTNQDDGFSIEYQQSEIEEYLEKKGMELTKAHIDQAQTATKVAGREAFFELVRDVQNGLVDVIIVYKLSRMFRNSEESEYYRKIFRRHNVQLVSVTETINEATSSGRLTTSILSNIDQYQSEVISEHVRAGLREMAKQGLFTGRPLLIGYKLKEEKHGKKKRKKFEINEDEAPLIRRIFQLYVDGKSCRQICKILKEEGIKTRRGYNFSEQTLRRMLDNDFYCGVYRYKVRDYEELVLDGIVPAIIDKHLFNRVQERKRANDPKLQPRNGKRLYALTGKLICGKCGSHYIGTNSTQNTVANGRTEYNYYTCQNRKEFGHCDGLNVRKEWTETEVIKVIRNQILNAENIDTLAQQVAALCEKSPSELKKKISDLKKQKAEVQRNYDKFIETFFSDESQSGGTLAQQTLKKFEHDLLTVEKQLHNATEQLRFTVTPESIKARMYDLLKKSNSDNIKTLKTIFDEFVEKVIVNDDELKVILKVYPVEKISDRQTLPLPFVMLSEIFERPVKYRPRSRT